MTTTAPAASSPSSAPVEDDVECLIKKPHWSRRLVVHIFRMALAMGLAFAISVFAVVLYVSDYRTKPPATQPAPVPVVREIPADAPPAEGKDEEGAAQATPPEESAKAVLRWIFGN